MDSKLSTSIWRYLDTGFSNGYENMAIDEAIYISCQQGKSPPTLRFYGWTPPAVSLGYFQKVEESVDFEACRKLGIDLVRRLSGGRAVLHDKELTYSIICPEKTLPFSKNILETYKLIGECLISALSNFNLNINWVTFRNKYHRYMRIHKKTASCFSSHSWFEITVDGRKICGSAQKRGGGVLLQHGSILLEHDPETLAEVFSPREKSKEELLAEICASTTSINSHLSKKINFIELKEVVLKGFENTLGISTTQGMLTAHELILKEKLLEEKYRNSEWNLQKISVNQSRVMTGILYNM